MDTDCGPAIRARPLGLFAPHKTLYPGNAYGLEVFNHAHPVFCPVTLVHVCQQLASKARTVAAVTSPAANPAAAILDSAPDAGLRLALVVAPATGASIPGSQVCSAQSAVHPTGRDEFDLIEDSSRRFGCNTFPLCRHEQNLADSKPLFNCCGTMV